MTTKEAIVYWKGYQKWFAEIKDELPINIDSVSEAVDSALKALEYYAKKDEIKDELLVDCAEILARKYLYFPIVTKHDKERYEVAVQGYLNILKKGCNNYDK